MKMIAHVVDAVQREAAYLMRSHNTAATIGSSG